MFSRNTAVVGVADMYICTPHTFCLSWNQSHASHGTPSITPFCIVERKPHLATFPATSRTARPIPTSCTRWSVRSSGVDRNESAPATRPKSDRAWSLSRGHVVADAGRTALFIVAIGGKTASSKARNPTSAGRTNAVPSSTGSTPGGNNQKRVHNA